MIAPDLYNDLMNRLAAGSRDDLLLAERLRAAEGASTLKREAARREVLYVTFGVQYGTLREAQEASDAGRPFNRDPHPYADWATGQGYLAVEYGVPEVLLSTDFPRERALEAASTWLGGVYSMVYDEQPEERYAPLGEVARIVLP